MGKVDMVCEACQCLFPRWIQHSRDSTLSKKNGSYQVILGGWGNLMNSNLLCRRKKKFNVIDVS